MNISLRAIVRALSASPAEDLEGRDPERSVYERFAIPHTFKPQLSPIEASISIAAAFLRILFGSILFGFSGGYAIVAWNSIRNPFWRVAAVLALTCVFLISFAFLMLAISALVRMLWPKPKNPPGRSASVPKS
jgi:hypothetical protein